LVVSLITPTATVFHVSNGEATKRGILLEDFDDHHLLGLEEHDGGVTRLDTRWVLFSGLTSTSVNLGTELFEFASNVSSVAIQDWRVAGTDLTGVVEDHDLGEEIFGILSGIVLGVRADIASLDILDRQVLDVETNVVTRGGLVNLFVMHFDGLDFSGGANGSESDDHTGLDDTSLDTTDGYCSDTADLVDVLEGKTEGLVHRSLGWGISSRASRRH